MPLTQSAWSATIQPFETAPADTAGNSSPDHKIVQLAALWPPFDPTSGVIQNPAPVDAGVIETVERSGYVIVAPVDGQAPYTHVISAGNHDYLAALDTHSMPSET